MASLVPPLTRAKGSGSCRALGTVAMASRHRDSIFSTLSLLAQVKVRSTRRRGSAVRLVTLAFIREPLGIVTRLLSSVVSTV